ncbi:MAG: tRNA (adenosine(37)-N6)-threonylcarbamoyltransferase complex ATPase subunit type 1 TsaE [Gammaproteobacteria bacterium]|nr:tRNA (adenosine(37)-N6)-threonylcarbamoyltransferase complex ATPase subunit type 1 TsaE [Gammaproteobacteria bacterium]NND46687.1 tRNA (adenosine(37)-N6)-threonylcarbamoyltransferase complex ATPase subunit type 1 TsaE [Woeseiaceae bacterium]
MTAQIIHLADEAATISFSERCRDALTGSLAGWTILLEGELGAGKSTFARGLIRAFGHHGAVPSPTYTLVEPYEVPAGNIYHIDLYRISDVEELRYLGFNELADGLRLIEWPERVPALAETADLRIKLAYDGDGRTATLKGLTGRGADVVGQVISKH